MAKKIPEEIANRLFTNMFVCMKCGGKMKAPPNKVSERKIKCRKCGSKQLRKKAKERRGLGA